MLLANSMWVRKRCWCRMCIASAVGLKAIVLAILMTACGTPLATPAPARLTVVAPSSVAGPLQEAITAYTDRRPEVTVVLETVANAPAAEAWVRAGRSDLAISTIAPAEGLEPVLDAQQIAWEALAVVVHADNPVSELSQAQLRQIYSGRIQDWEELGGTAGHIQLATREAGSGSRAVLQTAVLEDRQLSPSALIFPEDASLLEWIDNEKFAVGYVPTSEVNGHGKVVAVSGIVPEARTAAAARYPLLLPIYAVMRAPWSEEISDLVAYLLSNEGQTALGQRLGRVR